MKEILTQLNGRTIVRVSTTDDPKDQCINLILDGGDLVKIRVEGHPGATDWEQTLMVRLNAVPVFSK